MSKINELFNIENYNLIQDENYYYVFRALNNGDHNDLKNGITRDKNGKIVKVRTDRARYIENPQNGVPKYEENAPISLLQVIDHIKEHHRYDTNCISLSSNANVSIMYGNGYYADEYTVIRVPKSEIGKEVINAGEYMLGEINTKVEDAISKVMASASSSPDDNASNNTEILELMKKIDEAEDREELLDVVASSYKLREKFEREFTGTKGDARKKKPLRSRISEYETLNDEQNLLKNKLVAKLTILEEHHLMEPIMPHTRVDSRAIATLGLAFSSRELLHYGEIKEENLFEASKEFMHMLGLLQQTIEKKPELADKVHSMENSIINYIVNGYKVTERDGHYIITNGNDEQIINIEDKDGNKFVEDSSSKESTEQPVTLSIKQAYELTGGSINFQDVQETVNKLFYLSKSTAIARQYSNVIDVLTGRNAEYTDVIDAIYNK
ncbi:MAG: hypothetical protein IKD76_03000 [Clostridia bacterium]|nr:hypothetical protein [Clostridia bacterium]